jgi:hypothetical protein
VPDGKTIPSVNPGGGAENENDSPWRLKFLPRIDFSAKKGV